MLARFFVSGFVALACLVGTAGAAGSTGGKIVFKNTSQFPVTVDPFGEETGFTLAPLRGKAVFHTVDRAGPYLFNFDGDGDLNADLLGQVSLNGNKQVKLTIGDFGLVGILSGP